MAESRSEREDIPITRPLFGPEELEALREPLESGWIVQGPQVAAFEEAFAEFTGCEHAVATSSCTTALHLAMALLGVGHGHEVIVPSFTWVSTANVVEYMHAKPVFCDVRLDTFNIDEGQLEDVVSERTVGIIPVHLFGLCAEMEPIRAFAERHGLWVVEDGACALGAWQEGAHAGTIGDIGCFSFHPRKSVTTGEGGMLTTANDDWARRARSLRDHGASRSDLARHESKGSFMLASYDELGYNYRMTDLQGALGRVQMGRAPQILAERTRLAERYNELLAGFDWLRPQAVPAGNTHGWQAYVCLYAPDEPSLDNAAALGESRDALMARLEERGIATRPGTHAPVNVGYYREKYGLAPEDFPAAQIAERLSLALPLYPGMSDADQDRVVEALETCAG